MNSSVQDEILRTIDIFIQKRIEQLNLSREVPSVVQEYRKGDNRYRVMIDGVFYWVIDGVGISDLKVSSSVWVRIPNNNISDAYICGLRKKAQSVSNQNKAGVSAGNDTVNNYTTIGGFGIRKDTVNEPVIAAQYLDTTTTDLYALFGTELPATDNDKIYLTTWASSDDINGLF